MKLNSDQKTTAAGAILAAVVAGNIDLHKMLQGDVSEISKALAAALVALWAFYTNKQ